MEKKGFTLRLAVVLSAVLGTEESLPGSVLRLLRERGFEVTAEEVAVAAADVGASAFFRHRDAPASCSIPKIKTLLRDLWFADLLAAHADAEEVSLRAYLAERYELERTHYGKLSQADFGLFRFSEGGEDLAALGEIASAFSDLFPAAYAKLHDALTPFRAVGYMPELYNARTAASPISVKGTADRSPEAEKRRGTGEDLVTMLRDQLRVSEGYNHDLEVKLEHAKKDAVRDILLSLTDIGWGAPLQELYRVGCSDTAPEEIKGAINNLFRALESEGIRTVKGKEVGKEIILNEENMESYDPFRHEEIVLGESATVYYPGYRYDREIMIKPVVRRNHLKKE